jgi:hypothetical protein
LLIIPNGTKSILLLNDINRAVFGRIDLFSRRKKEVLVSHLKKTAYFILAIRLIIAYSYKKQLYIKNDLQIDGLNSIAR